MDFTSKEFVQRRINSLKGAKEELANNGRDYLFKEKVTLFKPHDGDNTIRILPPSWDNAKLFGLITHTHYRIGLSQSNYLCPEGMLQKPCPICQEARKLGKEDGKPLVARKAVLVYLIDRRNESQGPLIWQMPFSKVALPLVTMSDKYSGEYKLIDHPETGRDVSFTKTGKDLLTQYIGVMCMDPSPLSSDKLQMKGWLDYIVRQPLPTLLEYKTAEYLSNVLYGNIEEEDHSDKITTVPSSNGNAISSVVKKMSYDDLVNFVSANNLELDPSMFNRDTEVQQFRDAVLMEMNLD